MEKKKTRAQNKKDRTRIALLASAHQLMSDVGIDATSLLTITDRADTASGTFYNYFSSKEHIATEVLDCVIRNLAVRHAQAIDKLDGIGPLEKLAISLGCAMRELQDNPIWYWWLQRPDLLMERMQSGFGRIGKLHLNLALEAKLIVIPDDNIDSIWRLLIWQMVGYAHDISIGKLEKGSEKNLIQSAMQGLGVLPAEASVLSGLALPDYPELTISFES